MKSMSFSRKAARGVLVAAAMTMAVPATVYGEEYVLTAGNWGKKQTAAVQAAGGSIVWSHRRAGIGVVTADADFLSRLGTFNAFQTASLDQSIQWQPDTFSAQVVSPGDDTFFPLQWNLQSMNVPAAWSAGCTGAGARVAVIDGGIDSDHPDLEANLDKACSVSFAPGQPYDTDTGNFWHGTHVAGIIAAIDNQEGVVGVAPDADLFHIKALHDGTGSFGAVIGGILYAADPAAFGAASCGRADVINMSLGALFQKIGGAGPLIGALNQAVNFAASQGVLVVSSAGNEGVDMRDFPALTHVPSDSGSGLSISATGPLGFALGATDFRRPASYSNFGNGAISVAAPGGDFVLPGDDLCTVGPVLHFCWVFDLVVSTDFDDGYAFSAGTSMASPAAAGVAALIVGNNPGISLGALKAKLQQSADDEGPVGHDPFYGYGFVNAHNACMQ